jgi:hypothetical protein
MRITLLVAPIACFSFASISAGQGVANAPSAAQQTQAAQTQAGDEFLAGGEAAVSNGKKGADAREREIKELKKELAERDQVIGELTIANRILKKTQDGLL